MPASLGPRSKTVTAAAYTVLASDVQSGLTLVFTAAVAVTVTVPNLAGYPGCTLLQGGVGGLTVVGGSGVTLVSNVTPAVLKTGQAGASLTLTCAGATAYVSSGAGLSRADVTALLVNVPSGSAGLPAGSLWRDGTILRVTGTTPAAAPTGAAFYVSGSGVDTAAGTAAAPFKTLGKAVAAMRASATVKTTYVLGGTYPLTAAVALTSADNSIAILAYPGQAPIFDGGGTLANLITMDGCTGATIQGLQLQKTVSGAAGAEFNSPLRMVNGSNNNNVLGCRFTLCQAGIVLVGSSGNTVAGCQFDNWVVCGVEFKDASNSNVFDSNFCDGAGSTVSTGETTSGAFYGHGVSYNVISSNLVQNCPGTGITIANFDGPAPPIYTLNVGNAVRYNTVLNCGTVGTDTGSIYTVGRAQADTQMTIEYNYVSGARNLTQANKHIVGIYLDDEANGVLVRGNIVRDVQDNCIHYHGGQNCVVMGNVIDMGSAACTATLFQEAVYAGNTQAMTGNLLQGNIIYSSSATPTVIKDFNGGTKTISNNLYFNTQGAAMTSNSDGSPKYGNPLFTNAANGDYSLQAGTAAALIGFAPIPQQSIGLNPKTAHWY